MAIETTIYSPRTLGKLITRMPPVHTFFRDTLFKNRRTFPTKSVDVDFKKGSRALAPFVHPKVRTAAIRRRLTPPFCWPLTKSPPLTTC